MNVGRQQGAHRIGSNPPEWRSRTWDRNAHLDARVLDEQWSNWTVFYGTWSRRFYAIALSPVNEPVVVDASTPDKLEALMQHQEMVLLLRPVP
ncbi:hypothetical protein [Microbispora bryophytorum]|uniref:hypothetical protein n=1 Tax=Microbispora bryophytorum TaxID=1460882 RepID=UPI0034109C19